MTLPYSFFDLKNITTIGWDHPKIYSISHSRTNIKEINHPRCYLWHERFDTPDCITWFT
jgi:hypothetical protein